MSLHQSSMGVHDNEGTLMFSSIALLQQSFSELERIKEKREVRLYQILARHGPDFTHIVSNKTRIEWSRQSDDSSTQSCCIHTGLCVALLPSVRSCQPPQLLRNAKPSSSAAIRSPWPSEAYKHACSKVDV
ncbi:hypothetical protein VPH35_100868 [Triticum aestivum]